MPKLPLLVSLALVGFASNSLLCRLALGERSIDAASFTTLRLLSGAIVLALLARRRVGGQRASLAAATALSRRIPWAGAGALFAYAIAFSFAYLELPAGTGALLLFAAVQLTMIGSALLQREWPAPAEALGVAVSLGGLVLLTWPGLAAPEPLSAGLMLVAGVAWGIYTLLGRGSVRALADTASNFLWSLPLAALASVAALSQARLTPRGVLLAILSGALASGLGYALWYAALPALSKLRAAVVQLAVPLLAAAAGVVLLGEALTARLVVSGTLILAGIGVALAGRRRS